MAKRKQSRITQPPIRVYGYDDTPDKIVVVQPDGSTTETYRVINAGDGWYADIDAEHCGKHAIITRADGEADLIKLATTPGVAQAAEDE